MNVLIASPEINPLAKTGGLADVTGSLPLYIKRQGIDVSVVMPKYRQVQLQGTVLGDIDIQIGDSHSIGHVEQAFLPNSDIPLFLICNDSLYNRAELYTENGKDYPDNLERYTFFCKAILQMINRNWIKPDLIHANDWQTALLPVFIKTIYRRFEPFNTIKTLYTIHNLAYQGVFSQEKLPLTNIGWEHFHMEELEFYNKINLMKGGIVFADHINTVSSTYAKEIQTEQYGCGLAGILQKNKHKLSGILNGVDYEEWSPETDTLITSQYGIENFTESKARNKITLLKEFNLPLQKDRSPVLGIITRLDEQKGLDLVIAILPTLIHSGAQVVILGAGDPKIVTKLKELQTQFPDSFGIRIERNNQLAHLIEAGSDIFLMPSRFEPCGLNQMYSLRYGTVPVVRATGGLADTIRDVDDIPDGNGFSFEDATPANFLEACERAITLFQSELEWNQLIIRIMSENVSWDRSAKEYVKLYHKILANGN